MTRRLWEETRGTRDQAVKKAGRRLWGDMAHAAQLLAEAQELGGKDSPWTRAYYHGLARGMHSRAVKACLLTAFGA